MPAATLKRQWTVANNGGWAETFNFSIAGMPDDLSGCSAVLNLIQPGLAADTVLTYATTDVTPYLTISGGSVVLSIPESVTIGWAPGTYNVQLRVIPASPGVDRYSLMGPGRLTVLEAPGT